MKTKKNYTGSQFKMGLVLMLTVFSISLFGQTTTFSDNWSRHGISLQSQDNNSVNINFSVESYSRHQMSIKGEQMEKINVDGSFLFNDEGAPDLPVINRYIAVPQGATAIVNITNSRVEHLGKMDILPAAGIPLDTEKGPLEYKKNNEIYLSNNLYPSKAVVISEPMKIRGLDVVMLSINPFQYNPVTKEVIVNRDLEIDIEFSGGNGHFGEDKYRNRFWDPILRDAVINDESISFDYDSNRGTKSTGCDYLIIIPDDDDFMAWADTIKVFRQRQGILTNVVTISEVGGNTSSAIEAYINDAYNNWDIPPAAVLLLADYGNSGVGITSPIYDSYCISDNKYADVNNDHLPDITFARMTARNAVELELLVNKALNYERNPPTNPGFYDNPITAMGWQTERWFQICSEVIAGYFTNVLGKSPVRENALYDGSPSDGWSSATNTSTIINYFGASGLGYIPDTPWYLNDFGGNATRVNNDINAGAFLLQHRDHGNVTVWGEPSYNNSNVSGTTNTDLTYIFSINCLTGKFNTGGDCLVEKFHRHEHAALGVIGATESSYSFVNDTYVWGMYDNMWPDFLPEEDENPMSRGVLPAFGNVAGKYFLQQSGWPYNTGNKEVTYYLFHAHGDAFTQLYYEVPQNLVVNHDVVMLSGLDYFTVTADEGSFICLTVDNEIIATAEGTGESIDIEIPIQLPGITVDIVVTKQNYYRYENSIGVIPPEGAYCIYDIHQINDSLGNDNGFVEFDEEILISMAVKNLGNEDAPDVVVTLVSDNEFCTMIDTTENYDTIVMEGVVNKEYAYKFYIADNIPDQTSLEFDVKACDALDSVWMSKLYITVDAPLITPDLMLVDDSETGNDNGMLDPGETAKLKFLTTNLGHCDISDVLISIIPYNNYITVNSDDQIIPVLSLLEGSWVEFEVSVSEDAPQAVIAEMRYSASAAGYVAEKVYFPKIGQFLEDWETGDFSKYDWVTGGNLPWVISTEYPYEGDYHAVSGDIDDQQTSTLSLTYEVMGDDVIRFWRKVSSENNYDELRFYIDGTLIEDWSGTYDYEQVEFPVSAGMHTFKWEYFKDYSASTGADAVWIDNIELPTMLTTTIFAGPDAKTCSGGDFGCDASSTNYNTILWETAGDGTFSDASVLNPVYTSGENDSISGLVVLTLNIVDNEDIEYSDDMTLTFVTGPATPNMPAGDDYVDVYKVTETSYTTNFIDGVIDYNWELWPVEAGDLVVNANEVTINWNLNFIGDATLKVSALDDCGWSEFSDELIIFVDNTVGVNQWSSSIKLGIAPNPNNGVFRIDINTEDSKEINIKMINYLGVSIFELQKVSAESGFTYYFDNGNLSSGVYLISINQGNKIYSKKLIIN